MDSQVHRLQTVNRDLFSAGVHAAEAGDTFIAKVLSRRRFSGRRADAVRRGGSLQAIRAFVSGALVFADLGAICLSALIAELSAHVISEGVMHQSFTGFASADLQSRVAIWACLAMAVCIWFGLRGTYTVRNPLQYDIKQSTSAFGIVLLVDGFVEYAARSNFSRLWIILTWVIAAALVPLARVQMRRLLSAFGVWEIGATIMGSGEHSETVDQLLSHDSYVGYAAAHRSAVKLDASLPLPDIAAGIAAEMQRHGAEIVILAPDESELSQIDRVVDALNSGLIPYVMVPPIQRVPFAGLTVQSLPLSDMVLLTPRLGLMSPVRRKAKRLFDIVVSAVMLVFLAPVFAILALVVSVDGGAPFFGHLRVGRAGKPFRCLKFRSMARDADKILARVLVEDPEMARQWATNFKLDNDPRITKIGKFLRTTSLDELPQLINVLRGEMSLVGPRPVVAKEIEQYYGEDVFYYQLVRPGITGLWQVSGRSDTTYDRRVFLDAWYVRNWDHWTDLAILLNTVPSVLRKEGAK